MLKEGLDKAFISKITSLSSWNYQIEKSGRLKSVEKCLVRAVLWEKL